MRSYIHGRKKRLAAAVGAALLSGVFSIVPVAEALPVLDAKDAAVSIATPDAVTMNITSGATNNLIKWVDFSIGKNESVNFNDTNNYLNYVTGSARSDILGTLTGGGHIWLVNPNGILIGDGATVNVGSLHLSTRTLTDGVLNSFVPDGEHSLAGAIGGDVINMGNLNATNISVEGNNITFKNVADVKHGDAINTNVTLTASGGEIHIGSATGGASGYNTSGTTYNYKLISTKEALQNMKNDLDGNYMLAGDIDMSGVSFTPVGYRVFNSQTGEEDTCAFKGRFDGLGYAVKNLSVNINYEVSGAPGADNKFGIGLFGWNKGTVENVKLSGGSIKSTQRYVGIIGINSGTVRSVFNNGVRIEGHEDVGGIVGQNEGTITNVWNTGTVSGDETVGGIAGISQSGGAIANAYNDGSVSGSSATYAGGIVGNNLSGNVLNVYNTGTVSGYSYTGGIAGVNLGNIQYAYNTGTVKSSQSYSAPAIGGIAGDNRGTIENAYSKTTPVGNGSGGTAVAEADMKKLATFTGFDFSENGAWRIYEGKTMPLLTAFLTRKDEATSKVYDGSADVGKTVTASAKTSTQTEGIDWVSKISVITPKDLTITGVDKTYDGTKNATLTVDTLDGVIAADKTALTVSTTSATYNDKNAGTNKTVTYEGLTLSGGKAGNYSIAADGTTTGSIAKADITISTENYSRPYDGTTDASGATLAVTSGRIFDGDAISGGDFAFTDKNAGENKTVTVSGVTVSDGNNGGNYNVTYAANTASTIKRREAQVTFDPTTKVYDGTTSATPGKTKFWYLVDPDKGKVGVTADAAYEDENVGTNKKVKYTNVTLTGAEAQNYYLAQTDFNADNGTITRKALELVATPQTITEGEATPTTWSGSVTGFVAGEELGANDVCFFALDNPAASAVGSYKVTGTLSIGGAAPLASGNYGQNYTFANAASNATAFTIAAKSMTPQEIVADNVDAQGAVKEYTNVVSSLESGANTVLPTTNVPTTDSVIQTNSVLPTSSVLPTGNAQPTESNLPTGNAQPTEAAQENNSASGEQNGVQEQNGLLPAQQTDNGQPPASKQESHLGITYTDINMPKSMSIEALAASLNGEPTQQGNAGAQSATNGTPTEPTSAISGEPLGAEPAANGTVEDNEEA